jgi:type I restriction enzyme R subunit
MTNFAFLRSGEWRDLHSAASKAESYALSDPRTALVYGRELTLLPLKFGYTPVV